MVTIPPKAERQKYFAPIAAPERDPASDIPTESEEEYVRKVGRAAATLEYVGNPDTGAGLLAVHPDSPYRVEADAESELPVARLDLPDPEPPSLVVQTVPDSETERFATTALAQSFPRGDVSQWDIVAVSVE